MKRIAVIVVFFSLIVAFLIVLAPQKYLSKKSVEDNLSANVEVLPSYAGNAKINSRYCEFDMSTEFKQKCFWFYPDGEVSVFKMPVVMIVPNDTSEEQIERPIIYLAGGPGIGNRTGEASVLWWQDWLRQTELKRPLILLDLRGNYPGTPSWSCPEFDKFKFHLYAANYSLIEEQKQSRAIILECLDQYARYLKQTTPKHPRGLETFSTEQNAVDIIELMNVLAVQEYSIFGVSYGARLATSLALRDGRVDKLIIDSPAINSGVEQGEVARTSFAAADDNIENLKIKSHYVRAVKKLQKTPQKHTVAFNGAAFDIMLDDSLLNYAVKKALYRKQNHALILQSLIDVENERSESLEKLLLIMLENDHNKHNQDLIYFATQCNDALALAEVDDSVPNLNESDSVCNYNGFKAQTASAMRKIDKPSLVFAGGLDPVVPLQQVIENMRWFVQATLYVEPRAGHASAMEGACGYSIFKRFLEGGQEYANEHEYEYIGEQENCIAYNVDELQNLDKTKGEVMAPIWIDVRTQEEFNQGYIAGSHLIPYEVIAENIEAITTDRNADIRLYCRSGRRSGIAAEVLQSMGYVNAINEGGYEDLLQRKANGEDIP